MDLLTEVYKICNLLPPEQKYILANQMQRSALSIPSNIAEGWGRNSPKEYRQFLSVARGSAYELETQILACVNLGLLKNKEVEKSISLLEETRKMLISIIKKLNEQL